MQIRPATVEDLASVVSLTRSARGQLAQWSPVYFHPSQGADESHAAFLEFLIASNDHETFVLIDHSHVVGFFTRIAQEAHIWIDDLCVDGPSRWIEAVKAIVQQTTGRWVTCVSSSDSARCAAMYAEGLTLTSSYYARSTAGVSPLEPTGPAPVDDPLAPSPAHTFGGRPFTSTLPGALVVRDERGGYVIGSPSVTPPIYDPGGPTCVVDLVIGADRAGLIGLALGVASGRGDAQVVVVCAAVDTELSSILDASGFKDEVLHLGT